MTLPSKKLIGIILAITIVLTPTVVSAEESSGDSPKATSSPSPLPSTKVKRAETEIRHQLETIREQHKTIIEDKKTDLKERLDADKKKICDNHQAQINQTMKLMGERRQNAFTRITQVVEAAKKFYTDKQLSISNYDDLVANVDAAKVAAEAAMSSQQSVPNLDCSGDHPRADIADFKSKRTDSIDAMRLYRDAAKELVKSVRSAFKTSQSTDS